jgi:hypothetical protein
VAALLLLPVASANLSRTESYTLVSDQSMELVAIQNFSGGDDARAERSRADTDGNGTVSAQEAAAYLENEAASRLGNASRYVHWDAEAPVWRNITVEAPDLEGPNRGSLLQVTYAGVLNLSSLPGRTHTLTVTPAAGFDSWALLVNIPQNWTIDSVGGGISNASQTNFTLSGLVSAQGATIQVSYAPEAPPGSGDGSGNPPPNNGLDLSSAVLPLGIVAVLLAGLLGLAALRIRKEQRAHPLGGTAATAGPAYVLEGLLLLYKDGRLIHHQAAGTEGKLDNPEVVGSMFTAVTEFIRDSLSAESALSRLTYGQNTILLEGSGHLFGAAIVYGEPDEKLRELLGETLTRIESAFTGVVERWTGNREAFAGIEGLTAPLFALTAGLTRARVRAAAAERAVKLLSETEHYKGYLRLKLAAVNFTEERIEDADVTIDLNESVLRLARIDPPGFPRQGPTVRVGALNPGERVGVTYYLDPLACNQTNIEGRVTYLDGSGDTKTVQMKTRQAEIVCPIFFTREHANAATLKRLVETSLLARDARVYRVTGIPAGHAFKEVFSIAREAIQRHDVKLVRNITTPAPFQGKAWFYGQTKVNQNTVIIRVSGSESRHWVEFFVATDSAAALTGLLAELHRSFTHMIEQRAPGVVLEAVLDDDLKGVMGAHEFVGPEANLPASSEAGHEPG